jgi:CRP/FNR family transcriptional regulator, cyclic AMP receptor protein
MNIDWVEVTGYLGGVFCLYAYWSKTMIPLRIAAIVSNIFFMIFAVYHNIIPNILLNLVLLPLNVSRLIAMKRQIDYVKLATETSFNIDWLKPYMKPYNIEAGEVLFKKGDIAREAFFIVNGSIDLVEIGVTLKAGELLGEMGLVTRDNKRTMTAVVAKPAEGKVELLSISYQDFTQLYFQNPEFGFYLMRLMAQRMEDNRSKAMQLVTS